MEKWLGIVGIGEDGLDGLDEEARRLVDGAEVLVGGERHLAMLEEDGRERLAWPSPLSALVDAILGRRGTKVCVLATGDPMCFGVGVTLARKVALEEMTILPAPSAFSLVCARLGWPLAEVDCLTLHGRPLSLLNGRVQPGVRLSILSHGGHTPAEVAARLVDLGFGPSPMTVLEHMGGKKERRIEGSAADWGNRQCADFNTIAVQCVADEGARPLPRTPGLPDGAYAHDGQLTKREVRSISLAMLAPMPGQLLWDVGAGCGSIAIEWMRSHPLNRAVAIECNETRLALIGHNADALGAPQLKRVAGEAPRALSGLDAPDAVFIGGGLTTPGLVEACWKALKPGGRLVANAVTVEGERELARLQAELGGELGRIDVSRAEPVGAFRAWKPFMTVTQLRIWK